MKGGKEIFAVGTGMLQDLQFYLIEAEIMMNILFTLAGLLSLFWQWHNQVLRRTKRSSVTET